MYIYVYYYYIENLSKEVLIIEKDINYILEVLKVQYQTAAFIDFKLYFFYKAIYAALEVS